jgi:hypothetical protein
LNSTENESNLNQWQYYGERIYRLRSAQDSWITRRVSTIDFDNLSASWFDKVTLDVDCELVRKIWDNEDKYVYLPIALRRKESMFEFDARLPNNTSVSLAENEFRNYYLEYEFLRMCENMLDLPVKKIPIYVRNRIREIIAAKPSKIKSGPNVRSSIKEKSAITNESLWTRVVWARIITNDKIANFIDLLKSNSIIILKVPHDVDFSILKIADLNTGIPKIRKRWHFNIINPIIKFPLFGKIADTTKVIMPNDVRLSQAIINYKENGKAKASKLDIRGDGAWGVGKFPFRGHGETFGIVAISPRRSQMITTGLFLTSLAFIICLGCIWRGVKIDIFNSGAPSTIWTMTIPMIVFIFTRLTVKDHSSSYFYNMITRKYRTCLIISFVLLMLVCCFDDHCWKYPEVLQVFSDTFAKTCEDNNNHNQINPGPLTVASTFAIFVLWLGFFLSYIFARPSSFNNL